MPPHADRVAHHLDLDPTRGRERDLSDRHHRLARVGRDLEDPAQRLLPRLAVEGERPLDRTPALGQLGIDQRTHLGDRAPVGGGRVERRALEDLEQLGRIGVATVVERPHDGDPLAPRRAHPVVGLSEDVVGLGDAPRQARRVLGEAAGLERAARAQRAEGLAHRPFGLPQRAEVGVAVLAPVG